MPPMSSRRRLAVLATVCLAVFAINLDTTIVNVALPDMARQLGATTRDLQWIVDGYNLAFAALVLTGGSIGDRFGRRPVLLGGLAGFAVASGIGALCTGAGALVAVRFVMGAFAALIYPTTLSIITNAYPDRAERAKAIGVWGAVTGLGVAVGPVTGGLILAHAWWGGVFLALIPVALVAAALAVVLVPESRDPHAARLDLPGLATSSAGIGLLVYTIIEGPHRGWTSPWSIVGFAATAIIAATFVTVERRRVDPMLDVSLFRTPAFSAASGAVTVAFFALFGFIFLITQYFQFIRGYSTISTGVRILPVAITIAIGSVLGAALTGRLGTRIIVVTGLLMFGTAFAWIAVSATYESYLQIAAQMVIMGTGLGLTTAPATESILSVLPAAKAGVGSAVNDATREAGGTLGVAVIGSVFTSIYVHHLAGTTVAALPRDVAIAARDSVGAAITTAANAAPALSHQLVTDVNASFMSGLHIACLVAAGVCWLGAVGALALPGRRDMRTPQPEPTVVTAAPEPAAAG
ncbi:MULTISPECIES: MFS transporter [unclassified Frankia]|uniref:MFS transporter n=1 Tax=unclassified Frankia TaxID=2632575 RepID=UPI002AD48F42|nr:MULTISPECIES: MFS transporter [unclassified Frankia]